MQKFKVDNRLKCKTENYKMRAKGKFLGPMAK